MLLTLRDPKDWYNSRVRGSGAADLVCARNLWDTVCHPFSIYECYVLAGRKGLVTLVTLGATFGAEAYVQYNRYIMCIHDEMYHIYVYVYMNIFVYISNIHIHIHIHMYTFTYTSIYVYIYPTYIHIHT